MRRMRLRTALMALVLVMALSAVGFDTAVADGPGWGTPAVVALGDSYISGEAGRWAGNTNKEYSLTDALSFTAYYDEEYYSGGYSERETIPGCHRSKSAEIRISTSVYTKNLACSGARTNTTWTSSGYFKPGLDLYEDYYCSSSYGNQENCRSQVLSLKRYAAVRNVKMIVISIGGNDFEFGSVVQACVTHFLAPALYTQRYCKDDLSVTSRVLGNIGRVTWEIRGAIRRVSSTMAELGYTERMYTIIVQNYPSPIPGSSGLRYGESGWTRHTTGGCGFWNADADWAALTALPAINEAVRNAVASASLPNVKFMDLASSFVGRRLCENTVGLLEERGLASWRSAGAAERTEWISQIRVFEPLWYGSEGVYQLQEDFHPNYWAQLAVRNCVRQAYNGGTPRGGTCTRTGSGLNGLGEPVMTLY